MSPLISSQFMRWLIQSSEARRVCSICPILRRRAFSELQVRMREAHLRSASAAEDRVAEFQQLVSNVEAQLEEVQRSREAMRARFEEDLLSMTRKKSVAFFNSCMSTRR